MSFSGSSLARRHEVIGSVSVLGTCSVSRLQVSSGTMVPAESLAEIVVVVVLRTAHVNARCKESDSRAAQSIIPEQGCACEIVHPY